MLLALHNQLELAADKVDALEARQKRLDARLDRLDG